MQRAAGARLPRALLGLLVLLTASALSALANPQDYPEFAQHQVDTDIPIAFITSVEVKQRLDTGTQQRLVDVRDHSAYEKTHLPGAVSIPLRDFPYRAVEIPRDIPVVLY